MLASLGSAVPGLAPVHPSALAASLFPLDGTPIVLAAGPDGGTTLNANHTGAHSAVTGGGSPKTFNTTAVNGAAPNALRVRLTLVALAGSTSRCGNCSLELRLGSTASPQVIVQNGAVQQAQGPWVQVNATGAPGSAWSIWAIAQKSNGATQTATLRVALDIVPPGAPSPTGSYLNLTTDYTV